MTGWPPRGIWVAWCSWRGHLLLNLLTNAIKYTEQGDVTVSASADEGLVVISVADTGIGIPPEHIETIFQEFGRVDNSSTRKTVGLGLGLAISRQLIELLVRVLRLPPGTRESPTSS